MFESTFSAEELLPSLAWITSVDIANEEVFIRHGNRVETGDSWVVEGAWDGNYEEADFDRAQHFFGSGVKIDGDSIYFCASSALVDRLVYASNEHEFVCSNSLPLLLAATRNKLDPHHNYQIESHALLGGKRDYVRDFHVLGDTHRFGQVYGGNLVFVNGVHRFGQRDHSPVRLESFDDYSQELRRVLADIGRNLKSDLRRVKCRVTTTLSAGYDSAAVASLTKSLGVTECYTTSSQQNSDLEDGVPIANKLSLQPNLLKRVIPNYDNELYVLAATPDGRETIFENLFQDLAGTRECTALFTGYHGDKLWDRLTEGKYLSANVYRGDTSGLNLTEVRLRHAFINIAVPFIFAEQVSDIVKISNLPEMDRWTLGGDYDRPIPRRILEEAGVPRDLFGTTKKGAVDYHLLPRNAKLRTEVLTYLNQEYGFGPKSQLLYDVLEKCDWILASRIPMPVKWKPVLTSNRKLLWPEAKSVHNRIFIWAVNRLAQSHLDACCTQELSKSSSGPNP